MTWICSIYQWGDKVAGLSVGCLSQMGVKSRYIGELESPQITYVKAISKLLFLTLPIIITIFTLLSWLIVGRFPIEPWINLMWLHLISITSSSKGHWQCSDQKLCHRRARTWKKTRHWQTQGKGQHSPFLTWLHIVFWTLKPQDTL